MWPERDLSRNSATLLVVLVTLGALVSRVLWLGHGLTFHPDERHIVMTTMRLTWGDMNPGSFAYGSFPFYLLWAVGKVAATITGELTSYDRYFYLGRGLAAVIGSATVVTTYLLARSFGSPRWIGLLGAFFLGSNPFHLQLSRFFTVDIILTFLITLFFLALGRSLRSKGIQGSAVCGALAGVALGLAFATKVSSLPLLVVFGLVVVVLWWRERGAIALSFGGVGVGVAVATFLLAMPYVLFDTRMVIAHTLEQIRMVAGEWRPPYTIQYEGTAPFLYHLDQIWLVTWGPLLSSLALVGLAVSLRYRHPLSWLALIWMAMVFIATAPMMVKFPRYLLPLYPFLAVAAAVGLRTLVTWIAHHGVRRAVVPVVVFVALVSLQRGGAQLSIYTTPHLYEGASRWIFDNVPAGSVIMNPHWDDALPLTLPGLEVSRYQMGRREFELAWYEGERESKLNEIAETLARADVVVFPTQRIPGSLPRIEDEQPFTNQILARLFSGGLGYELAYSAKVVPHFGWVELPTVTADESLSVYDHPSVWVFRNVARWSPEQILATARSGGAPVSPEALLLSVAPHREAFGSVVAAVTWFLLFLALAVIGLPLARHLSSTPWLQTFMAPLVGIFMFGGAVWLIEGSGAVHVGGPFRWLLFGAALIWGVRTLRSSNTGALFSLVVWGVLFTTFAIQRAFQPEIFWGEKPMDFAFLNYFTRVDQIPPEDPWGAGLTMRYYYFGSYLFGLLTQLSGVATPIAYNLSMVTVGVLLVVGAVALFGTIGLARIPALIGGLLVALVSNYEWVRLLVLGREINFDAFWATTRLFTSPQISEYPLWAVLFNDLHAHLIAQPLFLLTIVAAIATVRAPLLTDAVTRGAITIVSAALTLSTNTWDFISLGVVAGVGVVVGALWSLRRAGVLEGGVKGLLWVVLVGAGLLAALLVAYPFTFFALAPGRAHYGAVFGDEFNSFSMAFRHLGTWLLIVFVSVVALLWRAESRSAHRASWFVFVGLAVLALLPLVPVAVAYSLGANATSYELLLAAIAFSTLGAVAATLLNAPVPGILLIGAGVIMSGAEHLFLMDRMNTAFKFYNAVWWCGGVGAIALFFGALSSRKRSSASEGGGSFLAPQRAKLAWQRGDVVLVLAAVLILAPGVMGSVLNLYVMSTFQRVEGPRPTLDGERYLNSSYRALFSWMRENITGTPTIVEAVGPSYREYGRVSMHTGLPALLGWDHHLKQRGASGRDVEERRRAVEFIYSHGQPEGVETMLRRHGVEYVVVGSVERATYPEHGIGVFARAPERFPLLFQRGEVALYRVGEPLVGER